RRHQRRRPARHHHLEQEGRVRVHPGPRQARVTFRGGPRRTGLGPWGRIPILPGLWQDWNPAPRPANPLQAGLLRSTPTSMPPRLYAAAALAAALAAPALLSPAAGGEKKTGGWTQLFNGKNLDGWDTWLGRPYKGKEVIGLNKDPQMVYTVA